MNEQARVRQAAGGRHVKKSIKERVAAATVKFPCTGGQGVLVPAGERLGGGLILTAAHCTHWKHTGIMALGDDAEFVHPIEVAGGGEAAREFFPRGRRLLVYPLAVESISDLAVLGAPDGQWMHEACEAFEQFCQTTAHCRISVQRAGGGARSRAYGSLDLRASKANGP
jgi:hypothetical protein